MDDLYCETSPSASMSTLLTGKLSASWGLYTSNNGDNSDLHEDSGFILPDSLDTLAKVHYRLGAGGDGTGRDGGLRSEIYIIL